MVEGGEFHVELNQAVCGIKGTTFAAEQTDEYQNSIVYEQRRGGRQKSRVKRLP
jgi:hypothetical protein